MIKAYIMPSCPDCSYLEDQYTSEFEVIDIGSHVHKMKEFIHLRDASPVFDETKKNGGLGIPCFVKEDGTITLSPEDVGLKSRPEEE